MTTGTKTPITKTPITKHRIRGRQGEFHFRSWARDNKSVWLYGPINSQMRQFTAVKFWEVTPRPARPNATLAAPKRQPG